MAVAVSLCASACGSATGPDPTAAPNDPGVSSPVAPVSTGPGGAVPSDAPGGAPVVFFRDGAITDEALAAIVVDGEVDATRLAEFGAAFRQLPPAEQAGALQGMSARYELESAMASGLVDAIGEGAAVPAIAGAWVPVRRAVEALDPSSVQLEDATRPSGSTGGDPVATTGGASGRLAAYVPVAPSRGPGLDAVDPGASAAGVGIVGILLAETGLALLADVVISAPNDFESADTYKEGKAGAGTLITGAVEQSTLEMDYDGKQDGVDVKFHTELVAHPCPDPAGTFDASAKLEIATSKGSEGARTTLEMVIHGQVDDDAKLTGTQIETRMQTAAFGGGQKGQFVDFTITGGKGREMGFTTNRTGGAVTSDMVQVGVLMALMFEALLSEKIVAAAEKAWSSGRCVRLDATATPGPKAVKPGSTSTILAPPRSRIDGSAVGGSVTAQLKAGGATVNPSATKVKADATFIYTAPDEAGKGGTVTLEARSKRGVGKATLDFTTAIAPTVTITGTVPYAFGSGFMKGTATIDLTMTPSPDGTYTGTAQVRMTGQLKSPGTTCTTATWNEAIELRGTLTSEDDQPVLVITTTGSAPTGALRPIKCTTAGVTINTKTSLLTSTLFGDVHVRLADGNQAFVVSSAAGTASGTVSVKLR